MSTQRASRGTRAIFTAVILAILIATPTSPSHASPIVSISSEYFADEIPEPTDSFTCPPRYGITGQPHVGGIVHWGTQPGDNVVGTSEHGQSCLYVFPDTSTKYHIVSSMADWTITGCGSGQFLHTVNGEISAPDPVTGERTHQGEWEIIAKTGTGELEGISGGGTHEGTVNAELDEAEGTLLGTVKC